MPSPAQAAKFHLRRARQINHQIDDFRECSTDMELIDSHDWRDLFQLIARPDIDEPTSGLPMPRERY